ncbi:hypothetical protein MMH89_04280 [Candidatus Comchoanobacter bicostacola]|uniref:Uncharacterized protein n=1 Tax=Candidatus Comchoanobacter bicostacola TaxID=2919598 RepID=A0ABY5DIK2_9GAMM|nr:hypothetical protein [Candidatus Comchoanobacter bicostacola]UTC24435.1 hypothetical protein MMH89_04280 [Candidatus Comchoanobacter bicostacola]
MPELDLKSTRAFWMTHMSGSVFNVINFLEKHEQDLLADNPEVQTHLSSLGFLLSQADKLSDDRLQDAVNISANLHMSQKLRLMQLLDSVQPGFASKMIKQAEVDMDDDENAATFIERNTKFERVRILQEVYAPERMTMISEIYEQN